jgi:hypothetical protein
MDEEQKHNMAQGLITDEEFDQELKKFFERDVESYEAPEDMNEPSQMQKVLALGMKEKEDRPLYYIAIHSGPEWDDDDTKHKAMQGLGVKLYEDKFKPVVMFHASDVWVSKQSSEERASGLRPKDDPNHEDAILMCGMTLDGRTNMAIAMVKEGKLQAPQFHFLKDKKEGDQFEDFILRSIYRGYATATITNILKK